MKKILDVIMVICSIAGSTLVASNIGYTKLGFTLFFVASCITVKMILDSNISRSQLLVTCYFMVINLIGIWRH